VLASPVVTRAFAPGSDEAPAMSRGQFWLADWGWRPEFLLAGDADGDGLADLLTFQPAGEGSIEIHRTSALGKPTRPRAAREGFGRDGQIAVCGRFSGRAADDVLAVFADGSVRLASVMPRGGTRFAHDDLVATIPGDLRPRPPLRAVAGDFDGDGGVDAAIVADDGRVLANVGLSHSLTFVEE